MILLTDVISQSSNFCVIVLDETTYYISAFAVDSNGTIIDVQSSSITTSFYKLNYEYSFIGKTISQLESDGWNIFLDKSNAQITSYGLASTSSDSVMIKQQNLSSILPNSKNVILEMTVSPLNNGSAFRLSLYRVAESTGRSNVTGPRISRTQSQTSIYDTNYTDSHTNTSTFTITTTLDFVNKSRRTSSTNGYSRTGTLSDTEISNIKNNSIGFYISSSGSTGGIGNMKITIK